MNFEAFNFQPTVAAGVLEKALTLIPEMIARWFVPSIESEVLTSSNGRCQPLATYVSKLFQDTKKRI